MLSGVRTSSVRSTTSEVRRLPPANSPLVESSRFRLAPIGRLAELDALVGASSAAGRARSRPTRSSSWGGSIARRRATSPTRKDAATTRAARVFEPQRGPRARAGLRARTREQHARASPTSTRASFRKSFAGRSRTSRSAPRLRSRARSSRTCWSATTPPTPTRCCRESLVPENIRKSLHDSNFAVDPSFAPTMSAAIITNNVKVAIIAFAGSITLGALTVYIIAFNGLMLGGMGALFTNAGFGYDFWATVAPHGVIELTAIQIAGAAGLLIAAAAIYPGRLAGGATLIVANARRAGTLILGVASMLIVAGTIEAFVSPRRWPESVDWHRLGYRARADFLLRECG